MQECGRPTRRSDNILRLAAGPLRSLGQPQDIVLPPCWLSHIHNIPSRLSAQGLQAWGIFLRIIVLHDIRIRIYICTSVQNSLHIQKNYIYRVFNKYWRKITACSFKILSLGDFQSLLGAHQMWSICKNITLKGGFQIKKQKKVGNFP